MTWCDFWNPGQAGRQAGRKGQGTWRTAWPACLAFIACLGFRKSRLAWLDSFSLAPSFPGPSLLLACRSWNIPCFLLKFCKLCKTCIRPVPSPAPSCPFTFCKCALLPSALCLLPPSLLPLPHHAPLTPPARDPPNFLPCPTPVSPAQYLLPSVPPSSLAPMPLACKRVLPQIPV